MRSRKEAISAAKPLDSEKGTPEGPEVSEREKI